MKRRLFVFLMILLLSLPAFTAVSAEKVQPGPTWEVAFDPTQHFDFDWISGAWSAMVFKQNMYFTFDTNEGQYLWGTSNGEDWFQALHLEPNQGIWQMMVYKYQSYLRLADESGVKIIRSRDLANWDLENWEVVAYDDWETACDCVIDSFRRAIFRGRYYSNPDTMEYGVSLLRSDSGDPGTWEEVARFPGWDNYSGFGVFKGAVYLGSGSVVDPLTGEDRPAQIWRSFDGITWEPVTLDGFGRPGNALAGGWAHKGGYFYAQMASFDGGSIWRTRDGETWEPVTEDGFGNPNNLGFALDVYQNMLYAYSFNWENGVEVFRSKNGTGWTLVNEPGWGDPVNWLVTSGPLHFKGASYFGIADSGLVMKLSGR